MPERLEKHGDVHVVIGQPRPDHGAGDVCPRCGLVIQEHSFLWPNAAADVALRLFVEACLCGIRFTDRGDQRLDETPQLWGIEGKWWCDFCDFRSDDRETFLAHNCAEVLEQQGRGITFREGNAP